MGGYSVPLYGWLQCVPVWVDTVCPCMGGYSVSLYGWIQCVPVWVDIISCDAIAVWVENRVRCCMGAVLIKGLNITEKHNKDGEISKD